MGKPTKRRRAGACSVVPHVTRRLRGRLDADWSLRLDVRIVAAFVVGALLVAGCVGARDADGTGSALAGGMGLTECGHVPELGSRLEGSLGGRQNPDPIVMGVLATYWMEHPDTYAGMWIDRDSGGVLVLTFTDDPETHREAILARAPSRDDHSLVMPKPPITDYRTLGEREDVTIDVVQVRYSEAELEAVQQEIRHAVSSRDFQMAWGIDVKRNRMSLDLYDPPEGALEELAEVVPDRAAVCVAVFYPPEPPSGSLDVIPDLHDEDPLVSCRGTPVVRYSQLVDPPSIDEVDHPAVDALLAELAAPGPEPMPGGRWVVISIDEDLATFAALKSPDDFGVADFERRGDRWVLGGIASGRPCEPTVALPAGLNRVEVRLDPDSPLSPDSTTVDLLVTEVACASGREMGDALQGPQVVDTDAAVLVAFAVIPVDAQSVTCQGNPTTSVSVDLSQPLGRRTIYDGLYFPPKPLSAAVED